MKRFDKEATRDPLILKKKKEGAKPFKRFINLTCGAELWHAQEFCAGAPERRVLYAFWDATVAEVPDRKVRLTNWSVTCSDEHIAYVHFFFYPRQPPPPPPPPLPRILSDTRTSKYFFRITDYVFFLTFGGFLKSKFNALKKKQKNKSQNDTHEGLEGN